MSYAIAKYNETQKLRAFRIYMSDCSQILCNNVAEAIGGKIINQRFYDAIENKHVEEKDPDEVINKIIAGLKSLGEEE